MQALRFDGTYTLADLSNVHEKLEDKYVGV